jgi:uncharacterized protein YggT (Ycf19 family)
MRLLLYISLNILIVGLFLYSKLSPYKDRLTGKYLRIFNFFDAIFKPVLAIFRPFAPPAQVGTGLAVDMSQILLIVILLIVLKFV